MKSQLVFAGLLIVLALAVIGVTRTHVHSTPTPDPAVESNGATSAAPVVVELFTSEGCSSCPPADQVLAQLSKNQPVPGAEVIALSEHVDYWNRLGWADPFSSSEFSQRQNDYASAFSTDQIYTPQMIIDGQSQFVGSDLRKAEDEIARATKTPKADVEIRRMDESASGSAAKGSINFSVSVSHLPAPKAGDTAEVLLAITQDGLASNVTRGENSGHRLTHTGVVRQLSKIGRINPQEGGGSFSANPTVKLPRGFDDSAGHAVVFVQERNSRRILGAASIHLSKM